MAAAPGRTIFNRSEIQTLGKSELISALLENDEDLLEAELSRKSNDELKQDLTKQSDQLLAEVRKKNEEVDGPEDDELDCDPLVSGDCAPKEPFEFFENDLAPPGQDRVITPAEMEVRELKAEISEANQYQQKQDVVFRQFVRGLLTENEESESLPKLNIPHITFNVDARLINYYYNRVYKNQDQDALHIEYFEGKQNLTDLHKSTDIDTTMKELNEELAAMSAAKFKCPDARIPSFEVEPTRQINNGIPIRMQEILPLRDYYRCNDSASSCGINEKCEYYCNFYNGKVHEMNICSLYNILNDGELDSRPTRFLTLCLVNLDIGDFKDCDDCAGKLRRAIRAAQIWVERNSDEPKVYWQTMIIMNAYLLFIQRFLKNAPEAYSEVLSDYMEYLHEVRHLVLNSKAKELRVPVTDMIGDIELTIGFIIKRLMGCTRTEEVGETGTQKETVIRDLLKKFDVNNLDGIDFNNPMDLYIAITDAYSGRERS